jgi:PAS domain S-box-containing protein
MATRRKTPDLLDTERRLRLLVDCVNDYALVMLDPRGRIVSWNAGAKSLKGYTADEIIGKNFSCFYTIEDVVEGKPDIELRVAARTGRFEDIGIRLRKDGTRFWANVIVSAIYDEKGELIGFGKLTRDITERVETEQKLAESEAKLKTLVDTVLDTVVDGLIIFDAAGRIEFSNPACERLFGYSSAELVGQNLRLLLPGVFDGEGDATIETFRRAGDIKVVSLDRELTGRRKDGSTFPMGLSVGEAKNVGHSIFVAVVHDLTNRKKTEQQLIRAQKMETVGQLSGGIAHDFNNLLTVIVGNADTLGEFLKARPDLKQYCESIVSAGMRGADLTQRLLAFGRRQALKPVALECNQLVESLRKLLRRTLREDIAIRASFESESVVAYADPSQLESAIINLALNAQDAMPNGGHLTIATAEAVLDDADPGLQPDVQPGRYVVIVVTDDGTGMSPEVRERVFEPFFTTKDVGKGTGLGLSMVYGFVKQSNGHIAIYSELGLGTTIRMYLPADRGGRPAAPAPVVEDTTLPDGRETVLVTEDDPFVRSYAVACLQGLGYAVITASDSREAIAKLADGADPDILFTDIVMPGGINGWELAQAARKIRPHLKVLLTSGYALDTLIASGRLTATTPILNKPYRRADLARALREALDAQAG